MCQRDPSTVRVQPSEILDATLEGCLETPGPVEGSDHAIDNDLHGYEVNATGFGLIGAQADGRINHERGTFHCCLERTCRPEKMKVLSVFANLSRA